MKILICDRCKNAIVKKTSFKMKMSNQYIDHPNRTFHLCGDCYYKFVDFLKETNHESQS